MQEKLISLKTAKLGKEKGFKESCEYAYINDFEEEWNLEDIEYNAGCVFNNKFHNEYSAPTQSLLQRWLREEHDININIIGEKNNYTVDVNHIFIYDRIDGSVCRRFNTYEQALEAGLFKALKLIKV